MSFAKRRSFGERNDDVNDIKKKKSSPGKEQQQRFQLASRSDDDARDTRTF